MSEAEWQRQFTELAELYGWAFVHWRPARTKHGWRTPGEGPLAKGWPDVVLVRERLIAVELKASRGKLSPDQERVRDILLAGGVEWYVFRPEHFDEAHAVLRERRPVA